MDYTEEGDKHIVVGNLQKTTPAGQIKKAWNLIVKSKVPHIMLLAVLASGVFIGARLAQSPQDIRKKAVEEPVPLTGYTGTYFYHPYVPIDRIPAYFDEVRSLGMDTLILSEVKLKKGTCTDGVYDWITADTPQKLGVILKEAKTRGIKVYVGLVQSYPACSDPTHSGNADSDARESANIINFVTTNFGSNLETKDALAGWSIVYESALGYTAYSSILDKMHSYLLKQYQAIRTQSALPVINAPYIGGVYKAQDGSIQTPGQVARKAANLVADTGIILVIQDGVEGASIDIYPDWSMPYTVKDYYDALVAGLGKNRIWSDNELGSYGDKWEAGGKYKASTASRVFAQLAASTSVGKNVVWLQHTQMGKVANNRQIPEGERLYDAYRAWLGLDGEYVVPASYRWLTPPASQYPDSGNEMFDKKIADPKAYYHDGWTGVLGSAEIEIDLGQAKKIKWVAGHLLNKNAYGIKFPKKLMVSCSADSVNWQAAGEWALPVTQEDSEYAFSNSAAMGVDCKLLRLRLENDAWTFVSEIEIIASAGSETIPPQPPPTTPPPVISNCGGLCGGVGGESCAEGLICYSGQGVCRNPNCPEDDDCLCPVPMGGVDARYFDNLGLSDLKATGTDQGINFDWGWEGAPVMGMGSDTFSVRWSGKVTPRYSETYTFSTLSDDGVRLWVGGKLIINNWTDHSPIENSGVISLTAGTQYDIIMDYYENTGYATAKLYWSSAGQAKEIVPVTQLTPVTLNPPPIITPTPTPTSRLRRFITPPRREQ